jgi:DNA-binding transcriptional MerR regulator
MLPSDERQYTLQELAAAVGVSIRTIRYYIGEGLLPAPSGAGPQSHYTQSHLNRLRAIGLLKDRYLPLKEIRKALSGLDEAQIDRLITDLDVSVSLDMPDAGEALPAVSPPPKASRLYLNEAPEPLYDALSYIDTALEQGRPSLDRPRRSVQEQRIESRPEGEVWRKIEVADGVELLVRDDLYRRRRDRVDWLIDWARKVVD